MATFLFYPALLASSMNKSDATTCAHFPHTFKFFWQSLLNTLGLRFLLSKVPLGFWRRISVVVVVGLVECWTIWSKTYIVTFTVTHSSISCSIPLLSDIWGRIFVRLHLIMTRHFFKCSCVCVCVGPVKPLATAVETLLRSLRPTVGYNCYISKNMHVSLKTQQ